MRPTFITPILLTILCLFTFGCATHLANPVLSGPQLAQHTSAQTVALVSDFGVKDTEHDPFCTGVWVGQRTILTAYHCVAGYAEHQYILRQIQTLVDHGVPLFIAQLLVRTGVLDDIKPDDPEASQDMKDAAALVQQVIPVPALGLDMPYIIQGEVTDMGMAPITFHHSTAYFLNKKSDLALLQVGGNPPAHLVAQLAATTPMVGENVAVVGHPHGNFWTYKTGVVSAYRSTMKYVGMKKVDGPFLQISAAVTNGDSGGGVFNDRGQLVGIVSFANAEMVGGYCIHLETIRSLLLGAQLVTAKLQPTSVDPDLTNAPLNLE